MKLNELVEDVLVYKQHNNVNPEISAIEMDSRKVQPGVLFAALRGFTVDGHDFVQQAEQRGAAAILAEEPVETKLPVIQVKDTYRALAQLAAKFYKNPTKDMNVIGVTGTNGKTTTTHLIENIFQHAGKNIGLIGTLYTKFNDVIEESKNTTPESLLLQQTFTQMRDADVQHVAMEVSSQALALGRVRGTDFNIAVYTNLTADHLDYHETMENYKQSKGLLFSQLGNAYTDERKAAVINIDDEHSDYMTSITSAPIITYGLSEGADVRGTDLHAGPGGTYFRMIIGDQSVDLNLKMVGRFNVYNALAAAASAYVSGISVEDIKDSLESSKPIPGRFETVDAGQDFAVIVDYAHTADSLDNILKTVKELANKNVYVVVGCGGDRDRTKRPEMARIAVHYGDEAIFTSDNPRSEDPEAILRDMRAGAEGQPYTVITDRKQAIQTAIHKAEAGDVVVIAGKGHETYQEVAGVFHDFDDRVEASQAIQERLAERG
ncbi:UDP-N-acetylmuramoyl-L-alanyl-D-glutamate--2,6-diaminopimelate ligase [Geomicrobium sp. JSM 1781026]|uniref:UDP-N-acetylmuramoyl-L-alanyl-D-glutamate--2, 6-diaminopimelate ligase n=1 Tax=Geomicrobium sp. JSM 1781026 TaxID=3344580 RepID=UPI0035C17CEE